MLSTDRAILSRRGLARLAAALLTAAAGGCTDSLSRRETIAPYAGNAMAANRAIHTIDPWPAASARTDIPVSARRAADAVERYEAPRPATGGAPAAIVLAPTLAATPGASSPEPRP